MEEQNTECTHDCSTCSAACSSRTAGKSAQQSFVEKQNRMSNVKRVIAVMSGKGGDLIVSTCQKVLNDEYADIADKFELTLPDEYFRRVGQSMAVASLPEL